MPRYARQDKKDARQDKVEAGRRPERSEGCLAYARKNKAGRNAKLRINIKGEETLASFKRLLRPLTAFGVTGRGCSG